MKKNIAGLMFLGVCIILAILLITKLISPFVSGSVFAIALVLLGGFSKGFRKNKS